MDTGHYTGGLGRATMNANVTVRCKGLKTWYLSGTAEMAPDEWNFKGDWSWGALGKDLRGKFGQHGFKMFTDWDKLSRGREFRTFSGSFLPGKAFTVELKGSVKIIEYSSDKYATFRY